MGHAWMHALLAKSAARSWLVLEELANHDCFVCYVVYRTIFMPLCLVQVLPYQMHCLVDPGSRVCSCLYNTAHIVDSTC